MSILGIFIVVGIDLYVVFTGEAKISDIIVEESSKTDCILVLGAGLDQNGKPSAMLKERLDKGIELYKEGAAPKIIVSGDHGTDSYDEVNVMKEYILFNGVPSDDIFMDHAGFSTYDSIYRAKEIFEIDSAYIVTQKYHLYRALYIARRLGIESYGIDAQKVTYRGQMYRECREIMARVKDFFKALIKPKSARMGDTISVFGSGNVTNDKNYAIIKNIKTEKERYLSEENIEEIKDIIERSTFEEKNCDLRDLYSLVISDDRIYGIEVDGTRVHLTKKDRESILNDEDSNIIFDMLTE